MPVILEPEDYDRWLDANTPIDKLRSMLKPLPADQMRAEAVSRVVNSVKNDNEEMHHADRRTRIRAVS